MIFPYLSKSGHCSLLLKGSIIRTQFSDIHCLDFRVRMFLHTQKANNWCHFVQLGIGELAALCSTTHCNQLYAMFTTLSLARDWGEGDSPSPSPPPSLPSATNIRKGFQKVEEKGGREGGSARAVVFVAAINGTGLRSSICSGCDERIRLNIAYSEIAFKFVGMCSVCVHRKVCVLET